MKDQVIAVVVTYNRKNMLAYCLDGLLQQSIEIEKIIIIDNASTDGTFDLLVDKNYLDIKKIIYFKQDTNTGGAGGFNAGICEALKETGEWLWLMDDDVVPNEDCLENLIKFKDISECLHPRRLLPNNMFYKWEQVIDLASLNTTMIGDISFTNGKEITFTNVGCFEGMLVSRRIVEIIGLPDPNYFIAEDDTLFGLKASVHTNVAYVKSAVMKKLIDTGLPLPWKVYYLIRNKFFLRKDALIYFNRPSSNKDNFLFILSNFLDVIIFFRLDRHYIIPALRGFFHGIKYGL
ncbi:MAG: glycosyltransferase [Methylococcales bacterium]